MTIGNSDNEAAPCVWCGETHPQTTAEKYFIAECERRGLPWQPDVMPEKAQKVASLTSILCAPIELILMGAPGIPTLVLPALFSLPQEIGGAPEDAPGLLPYYAAALIALSQEADEQAEQMFADLHGDLDDLHIDMADEPGEER